ncbi:MAG: OmpH family outer membrane protein [Pseudomonadota bacterium]
MRRRAILAGAAALVAGGAAAQNLDRVFTSGPRVLVVSRKRVLEESAAARALARRERELTARVQADVDRVKGELAAEEEALALARPTMARDAFDARAQAFRDRVLRERRSAQSRSAALQQVFRQARGELVRALGPILEQIRVERDADAVLNADAVLAAAPEADVTADAIAAFDAAVAMPQVEVPPGLLAGGPAAGGGSEDGVNGEGPVLVLPR